MSILSRIRNFRLTIPRSIVLAGAMIALSILYGTEVLDERIHYVGVNEIQELKNQNVQLVEIRYNIKEAGEKAAAPIDLDKETFEAVYNVCMTSSTVGVGEYSAERKRHCLNKILKTDTE